MKTRQNREGSILIIVAGAMVVILGIAAYAIDYAFATEAKYEMQAATDAAALAAIQKWIEDENSDQAQETAMYMINQNPVIKQQMQLDLDGFSLGYWDYSAGNFTSSWANRNAVRVYLEKSEDSINGPLDTFFARVVGIDYFKINAESVAALDNRLLWIDSEDGAGAFWPFSVDISIVDADGDGNFDVGNEVSFFPYRTESGNWGTVDLNGGSNSTAELSDWIEDGYHDDRGIFSPDDGSFVKLGSFPVRLEGDPGMSNGIKDEVATRVANRDTVFILVHNQVNGNGANCRYREISIVPIKLSSCKLTGKNENRYIKGEITTVVSSNIETGEGGMVQNVFFKTQLVK